MSSGARETAWLMGANTRVGTPMHSRRYRGTKPGYNTEVQYKVTIPRYNIRLQFQNGDSRRHCTMGLWGYSTDSHCTKAVFNLNSAELDWITMHSVFHCNICNALHLDPVCVFNFSIVQCIAPIWTSVQCNVLLGYPSTLLDILHHRAQYPVGWVGG